MLHLGEALFHYEIWAIFPYLRPSQKPNVAIELTRLWNHRCRDCKIRWETQVYDRGYTTANKIPGLETTKTQL